MNGTFRVAVHFEENRGSIEYTCDTRTACVSLEPQEKREAAEQFLRDAHEIRIPHETLMDFTKETIQPLDSLENFKLALTRMWDATGIYVDWSRPIEA